MGLFGKMAQEYSQSRNKRKNVQILPKILLISELTGAKSPEKGGRL